MFLGIPLDELFLWLFYMLLFVSSLGLIWGVSWFFESAVERLDDWLMGKW